MNERALSALNALNISIGDDEIENYDASYKNRYVHLPVGMKADMFSDVHRTLQDAMINGEDFHRFLKRLKDNLNIQKWIEKKDNTYVKNRLELIYETETAKAYSAGRTRAMINSARLRPYWEYRQVQRESKRETHSSLHGVVVRYDDSFWHTYDPPNGYRCRCFKVARREKDVDKSKILDSKSSTLQDKISNSNVSDDWQRSSLRDIDTPRFLIETANEFSDEAMLEWTKKQINLSKNAFKMQVFNANKGEATEMPVQISTVSYDICRRIGGKTGSYDPRIFINLSNFKNNDISQSDWMKIYDDLQEKISHNNISLKSGVVLLILSEYIVHCMIKNKAAMEIVKIEKNET